MSDTIHKHNIISDADLNLLYLAIYGRNVDDRARAAWAGKATIGHVLDQVLQSDAFINRIPYLLRNHFENKHGIERFQDSKKFYDLLCEAPLNRNQIIKLIEAKCFGGDYYEFHKKRFTELHGFVAKCNSDKPIESLLEISTMPFTTSVWQTYLSDLKKLSSIDLPTQFGGPPAEKLSEYGVTNHVAADLNMIDLDELHNKLDNYCYDMIIATEVIEHLQRDFSEICRFMLKCLTPGGIAFVTTPNAARLSNIHLLLNDKCPQQRFTNFNNNKGGHYHFREYTMSELLKCIVENGGEAICAAYSHCFFDETDWDESAYYLRSNLVIAFRRG